MDNYPPGATRDPLAPYNQSDPDEIERECEYSCVLKKVTDVATTDYIPGATYPEWDDDHYVAVNEPDDTSNTDWLSAYHECEYTPYDLICKLKDIALTLAEGKMPERPKNSRSKYWSELAKACEGWEQIDEECYLA